MTKRYPGGYITKTPPTVSTTSAPGIWTMEQQAAYQKAGTWPFGGPFNYIEDVFSTWLYTGNGSTQTITNGIDLSGKGGLVWIKSRSGAWDHQLVDTVRGADFTLRSNTTDAQQNQPGRVSAFNNNGFTLGNGNFYTNDSSYTYASWTFREQPKFFDVVTYTGTQNSSGTGQTVSHNLGSTPGCIIIKPLSDTSGSGFNLNDWIVYHRGLSSPTTQYLKLNTTAGFDGNADKVKAVSSTNFTAGWEVGLNGIQYVAYLFAHDAGGFGLTGTDNVISCGSCTGNADVNLGYEPQWVMVKRTNTTGEWVMVDNMRGMVATTTSDCQQLYANSSNAEAGNQYSPHPTSTGFYNRWINGTDSFIYIAIRRGPMKTPTSGTSVFSPNAVADDSSAITTNFPVDGYWEAVRTGNSNNFVQQSRLTGGGQFLITSSTAAQDNTGFTTVFQNNTGYTPGTFGSSSLISYAYRRAPSFFDVVCYTGTGSTTTFSHNLGVAPELMIVKSRSLSTENWAVGSSRLPDWENRLWLNLTDARAANNSVFNSTAPTASVFTVGTNTATNNSGSTYVAYLFASCPGVSKVGSYTGTGTTKQIDCGFTGGARFVLIKRTDSTGDWYVWDSARGIVAGNDPYLLLNSTAAEVTNTDYVDTYAAGFEISSTAPAAINANGGTFIFLAIA